MISRFGYLSNSFSQAKQSLIPKCTHFAWTNFNGGTCWFKKNLQLASGSPYAIGVFSVSDNSYVCGWRVP